MNGWNLTFTGWPWWAVLLLAALAVWAMVRWQRGELSHLPFAKRRALLVIRGLATGLIVLLLLEPTPFGAALERRAGRRHEDVRGSPSDLGFRSRRFFVMVHIRVHTDTISRLGQAVRRYRSRHRAGRRGTGVAPR